MKESNALAAGEITIDVRTLPPRHRHPTIFSTWEKLPSGGALLLIVDHNPLPLYYQFAAENPGEFHWEYLEEGPELWRVRIRRGAFSDPGFKPAPGARGSCRPQTVPISFVKPITLDVRPVLEAGDSPVEMVEKAAGELIPGQSLILLVPFEPVPLYTRLGIKGFSHEAKPLPDGTWHVEFKQEAGAGPEGFSACGCHDEA